MKAILSYLFYINIKYMNDETASTAMEYALIATVISVSIFMIVFVMGDNVKILFDNTNSVLPKAAG